MNTVDGFVDLLTELLHFLVVLAKGFDIHKVLFDFLLQLCNLALARLHKQGLVHSLHTLFNIIQSLHKVVCFRQELFEARNEEGLQFIDVVDAAELIHVLVQLVKLFLCCCFLELRFNRFLYIINEFVAAVNLVLKVLELFRVLFLVLMLSIKDLLLIGFQTG